MSKRINLLPKATSAIYIIINILNDKYYIGSAVNVKQRINDHLSQLDRNIHDNSYLQASWNKHGKTAFIYLILEKTSKDQLEAKEQHWIDLLESNNSKIGYNLRKIANSNQGHKWSEEAKVNLSNIKKGKPRSEETKEKLRIANLGKTGRKNTPEQRARQSEAAKLRWQKYHAAKQ